MSFITHRQLPPSEHDAAIARISSQLLSRYAQANESLEVKIANSESSIKLPCAAVALLMEILNAMAAGQGVTIMPENAELTTVQAAEVLNVSRPFLIKLLEENKIPYRKVGSHRRILMGDIMRYKAQNIRQREAVLEQLVEDAQKHNMGYEVT